MIAILLVGGLGTRLRPLTLRRPKALMPVLNAPFLSYQLAVLEKAKVAEVVFAASSAFRAWERGLRQLARPGMRFTFAFEETPLGTGGAIRFAHDVFRKKSPHAAGPFLVFNGDVLFDLDAAALRRFHERKKAEATVALTPVDDPSRFGLVRTEEDGRITAFVEKPKDAVGPSFINAGAYLLSRSAIEEIPPKKNVSVERDAFPALLGSGAALYGFRLDGYWNDIGTHATYLQAHRDLMTGAFGDGRAATLARAQRSRILVGNGFKALLGAGTVLKKSVTLEGVVCLGSQVKVGDGCRLKDCVVLDRARLGNGAQVEDAVIGERVTLGENTVAQGAVLGTGTQISDYSRC